MSEEDQRQLKAYALLDFHDAKQEATLLREKLSQIGAFFIDVGQQLQKDPHMYLYKNYTFPADRKQIDEWARALDEIEEKRRRAKEKAMSFGFFV